MVINSTPNSHIQLIVPESYLWGGATTTDSTFARAFDGDVDTSVTLMAGGDPSWTYPAALSKLQWTLVYRENKDDAVMRVYADGNKIDITDFAEEDAGQSTKDWTWSTAADTFGRNGASSHFSNVLCEHANVATLSTVNSLNVQSDGDHLSTLREVMFSRDYRVPMYTKAFSSEYYFASKVGSSLVGIKSPRFNLRQTYNLAAKHSFEWQYLTDAEKLVFEYFIRAFGGNMMRPFAMCVIHGTSPVANNVMTTRMLIIDSETINWSRDQDTRRHGITFSATELIPL